MKAIWITFGILFLVLNVAIGVGIIFEIDDLQTTIRLVDKACYDTP